jgi:hypothetical protein
MTRGASLRSRVKGNFQARFWNSGGRGDSPTDCSGIWFFHRLLAGIKESLAPARDAGSSDSQFARQKVESFPAQQTEHDLGLFLGGKPLGVSSTHSCSPLQSLCELLARGPLWIFLVVASGHLLSVTIPKSVSNQTVHQTTWNQQLHKRLLYYIQYSCSTRMIV